MMYKRQKVYIDPFPEKNAWWSQKEAFSISVVPDYTRAHRSAPHRSIRFRPRERRRERDPRPRKGNLHVLRAVGESREAAEERYSTLVAHQQELAEAREAASVLHCENTETLLLEDLEHRVGFAVIGANQGTDAVVRTIADLVDTQDISEVTIRLERQGYTAKVQGREGSTLVIQYSALFDSATIWRYTTATAKGSRAYQELKRLEPQANKKGWRDGSVTTDLGVHLVPTEKQYGKQLYRTTVLAKRKRAGKYNRPDLYFDKDEEQCAALVSSAFTNPAFALGYATNEEIEAATKGSGTTISLQIKGARCFFYDQLPTPQTIERAYRSALTQGLTHIFRRIATTYTMQVEQEQPITKVA